MKIRSLKKSKTRRSSSSKSKRASLREPRDKGNDSDIVSSEEEQEEEEEENESHEQLIQTIVSLDTKKKKRRDNRTEPSSTVSEVHLKPRGEDKVRLSDLVGGLKPSATAGALKKKIDRVEKGGKSIEPPLPKPQMERIQRGVAYTEASEEIGRWQEIVKKNREAEHLEFPLKEQQTIVPRASTGLGSFQMKPRTSLEKEIAALIKGPGAEHDLSSKKRALSKAEEKALKAMSLEKAVERRAELQKIRALQSFYERKNRRQNKIKSKKFHRLKKRAGVRAAEKLAADGEANEDELEKAESIRVKERMTLRHHNKSKWARSVLSRGRKDPNIRRAIGDQVKLGKELSRKMMPTTTEESEGEIGDRDDEKAPDDVESTTNLWLSGETKTSRKKSTPAEVSSQTADSTLLDPSKVLAAIESDGDEQEEALADVIGEAFANDDVVEQFAQDKKDEVVEQQPKNVDLSLPGWGVWGGPGTRTAKRVSEVATEMVGNAPPRRDDRLPHVIIREGADKKMKKHVISELPFPFTSPEQLERSLCAPVGQHWNTVATFHETIKPRVETLMGTVIGPMEKGKAKKENTEKAVEQKRKRTRKRKSRSRQDGDAKRSSDVLLTL